MVFSCGKKYDLRRFLIFTFFGIPGPLEATDRLPKINVRVIIWGILMHVNYFHNILDFHCFGNSGPYEATGRKWCS